MLSTCCLSLVKYFLNHSSVILTSIAFVGVSSAPNSLKLQFEGVKLDHSPVYNLQTEQ